MKERSRVKMVGMSRNGHNIISASIALVGAVHFGGITGIAMIGDVVAAIMAWCVDVADTGSIRYVDTSVAAGVFVIGAMAGSRAPDWLELPGFKQGIRVSVIPHRTLTHSPWFWFAAWAMLFVFKQLMVQTPGTWLATILWLGFCITGTLHILVDLGSPTGIPLGHPFKERYCLGPFYSTGRVSEARVVLPIIACVYVAHATITALA